MITCVKGLARWQSQSGNSTYANSFLLTSLMPSGSLTHPSLINLYKGDCFKITSGRRFDEHSWSLIPLSLASLIFWLLKKQLCSVGSLTAEWTCRAGEGTRECQREAKKVGWKDPREKLEILKPLSLNLRAWLEGFINSTRALLSVWAPVRGQNIQGWVDQP